MEIKYRIKELTFSDDPTLPRSENKIDSRIPTERIIWEKTTKRKIDVSSLPFRFFDDKNGTIEVDCSLERYDEETKSWLYVENLPTMSGNMDEHLAYLEKECAHCENIGDFGSDSFLEAELDSIEFPSDPFDLDM